MSCNIYDASRGKLIKIAPLYKPDIPDGKTVVPTDDVQILLRCAGIKDKDYTTISEVITDTDTFNAVIDSDNAVDYLVRSTDWASAICADSTSMAYIAQSQYAAEQLLDDSTWYTGILNSSYRDVQFLLKSAGIFDKNYTTISQVLSDTTSLATVINSTKGIDYLVRTTTWASTVTANQTAMTDIGLNNYAANTLLEDITWKAAIWNSSYRTKVLNVTIPTMTSNTTPSGVASSYQSDNDHKAFWAFDNSNATTYWGVLSGASWVQYQFPEDVTIYGYYISGTDNISVKLASFILYVDGTSVGNISRPSSSNSSGGVSSPKKGRAHKIYFSANYNCHWGIVNCQLYGRKDI